MPLPKCITIENAATGPAKIHVRGVIGSKFDPNTWTLTNTEEAVLNELNSIEVGKKIDVHINSVGGDVGLALGIFNAFQRRAADITTYNDGNALSAASILMLGGGCVVSPDSSVWMIHCAQAGTYGNASDKRKDIEMLEVFDKTLAGIYAKKTGKTDKEMLDLMAKETWLTGKEARDMGLADEDGGEPDEDDAPVTDVELEREIVATFRNIPENLRGRIVSGSASTGGKRTGAPPRQKPLERTMEKIIKALAAAGIKLPDNATDDQIVAAFSAMQSENQGHRDSLKKRVEARVKAAVDAKKIKAERQTWWVAQGLADESALDQLDEIAAPQAAGAAAAVETPKVFRGAEPVEAEAETENDTDKQIEAVQNEIMQLHSGPRTRESLERTAPKIGALARKLQTLRGDPKRAKVEFVKVSQN